MCIALFHNSLINSIFVLIVILDSRTNILVGMNIYICVTVNIRINIYRFGGINA